MYRKLLSELYILNEDMVKFIRKNGLCSLSFSYKEVDDLIVKCLEFTSEMDESNFSDDVKRNVEFEEFISYFDDLIKLRRSKIILNSFVK